MTTPWLIVYLAGNALASLMTGLVVVATASWLFRTDRSIWQPWLLAVPFAKVLWDALRALYPCREVMNPAGPILWDHGVLTFGGGVVFPLSPVVRLSASGSWGSRQGPIRIGDFLVLWGRRCSPHIFALLATAIAVAGLALAVRRIVAAVRFETERHRLRTAAGTWALCRYHVGRRRVDVYVSECLDGVPFAGGLAAPYVCFPARAYARLDESERRAALEHELSHITLHHIELLLVIGIFSDLLWFVPFVPYLRRKLERACERAADTRAVLAGADPVHLASALVTTAQARRLSARPPPELGAAALGPTALRERVACLLGQNPKPRLGFANRWLRSAILVVIVQAAMSSTLGGG